MVLSARSGIVWVALLALAGPAAAEEDAGRNRASFQVEAAQEVANDWAVARLSALSEGGAPAEIASEVNRLMTGAVKQAKKTSGIDVRTGSYTTHPVHEKGRIVRWRAFQELRLETADVDALSKLVGELQGSGLTLSGIQFSVAKETRRALEDELIDDALGAFQLRAGRVAKAMGHKGWSLVTLAISQGGGQPQPLQRGGVMTTSLSAAPPVFEGGSSEVRVFVNGVIELE